MASPLGHSVTIDGAQFEAILRRANVEYISDDRTLESLVCIPQAEYTRLVKCQRQHETLKRNLMISGMDSGSLQALCEEDIPAEAQVHNANQVASKRREVVRGAKLNQTPFRPYPLPRPGGHEAGKLPMGVGASGYGDSGLQPSLLDKGTHLAEPGSPRAEPGDAPEFEGHGGGGERKKQRQVGQRTLMLMNVPLAATYLDVTSVIRGGVLADIFLRPANRTATVSFLNEESAKAFFEYAQKNDIFINNEEIHVHRANRHYVLTSHVAGRAAVGATRNLVIRNYDVALAEDMIRADLEHIHGLVIIKVEFVGRNCYIKTNSIHHALYAKSCLRSQLIYKISTIEWDVDECDQPIESMQDAQVEKMEQQKQQRAPQMPTRIKKTIGYAQNRFQVLDDDSDM
ncbi:hypothetical protein F4776DRAFT_647902 [Hypoxylon sp. NC0597]|nr:hypothetical protein F4776DRAFT_647902 [Hypoxylon sp. NC0597]